MAVGLQTLQREVLLCVRASVLRYFFKVVQDIEGRNGMLSDLSWTMQVFPSWAKDLQCFAELRKDYVRAVLANVPVLHFPSPSSEFQATNCSAAFVPPHVYL